MIQRVGVRQFRKCVALAAALMLLVNCQGGGDDAPERAAEVTPKVDDLRLRDVEVPEGFELTEAARIQRHEAGARFVDGYTVFFDRGGDGAGTISLRADVYESADAVSGQLSGSMSRFEGLEGFEIVPIDGAPIGEEASAVTDTNTGSYSVVFRHENVLGYVGVTAADPSDFIDVVDALARDLDTRIEESLSP